ncbi:MAG: hypothetical protein EPN37_12985 [Chitinophagaceae bacterium]|nr:MAG: hypothetical protein EPN37_12985 [Chitinophagaceae bacterium]
MNAKVDKFLAGQNRWKNEITLLRNIILEINELNEDYKWMHPCYTWQNKNVVVIQGFKEYCALMFFKGVLMKDPKGILIQMTENVQASRQIRFTDMDQIKKGKSVIKAYIREAIEVEKSGEKVPLKKTSDFPVPEEFQKLLRENSKMKKAFASLTPGRQRGYLYFFSQAKQSKTRESRIENCIPKILAGKGLDD